MNAADTDGRKWCGWCCFLPVEANVLRGERVAVMELHIRAQREFQRCGGCAGGSPDAPEQAPDNAALQRRRTNRVPAGVQSGVKMVLANIESLFECVVVRISQRIFIGAAIMPQLNCTVK